MKNSICRFLADESGASSIEYCTIGGLIGVLLVISLTSIGTKLAGWFTACGDAM